jgi:hypothetical protein
VGSPQANDLRDWAGNAIADDWATSWAGGERREVKFSGLSLELKAKIQSLLCVT